MTLHPSFLLFWGAWRVVLIRLAPNLWLAMMKEEPIYRLHNAQVAYFYVLRYYYLVVYPSPLIVRQ